MSFMMEHQVDREETLLTSRLLRLLFNHYSPQIKNNTFYQRGNIFSLNTIIVFIISIKSSPLPAQAVNFHLKTKAQICTIFHVSIFNHDRKVYQCRKNRKLCSTIEKYNGAMYCLWTDTFFLKCQEPNLYSNTKWVSGSGSSSQAKLCVTDSNEG